MKYKNIRYILMVIAGLLSGSCEKQLNVFPTTSEVDGNVIVDTKSALTVLNGVYYRFADVGTDGNGLPSLNWTSVNEIPASEFCGSLNNSGGDDGFYSLTLNSNSNGVDFIWNYGYQLVNAANGFLKNIAPVTNIPAATKNQMIAEAKFLRAFGNSELLLYYGQYYDTTSKYGIILRNEFVEAATVNLPRSTVGQTYDDILLDLDDAIANLPAVNSQVYYVNVSAAKLLEARVLINRGLSDDYAKVISLTNDIINNGGFSLETQNIDLFLANGFSSVEVILGVQPFPKEIYKFQQNQFYGIYGASASFVSLLVNDPRNQWIYKNDSASTVYGSSYGAINEITKFYSGPVVNPVQTPLSENSYAFRLTEAYLLQAEAICLSNGDLPTAKTLLKQVEMTSGITDFSDIDSASTSPDLQLLIVKEEIKSFFSEAGQDWFALRRLPFTTAQTIQPALVSVNQLIMPIPNTEIVRNGSVIPNP